MYLCPRDLNSFPTRRSSDLQPWQGNISVLTASAVPWVSIPSLPTSCSSSAGQPARCWRARVAARDRKSTRLNSSHVKISYAVLCVKKKKQRIQKNRKSYDKK